jgi:hypothetical protein
MPLSWSISHPSRLVLVLAKGEFRPIDLTRLLASIDAAKASSYRKLIDVSRLTDKVPTGVLRELARVVRQRESERTVGPIAIVAGTTGVTRQANLFADEARRERLIEIFPDQHAARRWLNSFYSYEGEPGLGSRT